MNNNNDSNNNNTDFDSKTTRASLNKLELDASSVSVLVSQTIAFRVCGCTFLSVMIYCSWGSTFLSTESNGNSSNKRPQQQQQRQHVWEYSESEIHKKKCLPNSWSRHAGTL
ncbi:uncharacterized protein LOC117788379 [Drosophila innubila]|uniref:uncharacterized protein LOC117788379 n=1 Tax=Drosophila innubila TaxID=198719 RepID=UPI00148C9111|nr:uncharacterized protein LOC117788379 [Drosophila innubila]